MFDNKFDDDIAAGILVEDRHGRIRCVLDCTNGKALWKFPVGKAEDGESPEQCAVRELFEETGIVVDPRSLVPIASEWRSDHWRFLYITQTFDESKIQTFGIEDGKRKLEGKWIYKDEIVRSTDFLHDHAAILREFLSRSACA